MTSFTTFYVSQIIGKSIYDAENRVIGTVKDLLIGSDSTNQFSERPRISGIKVKSKNQVSFYSFQSFTIGKNQGKLKVVCNQLHEISTDEVNNSLYLVENILDRQIVDLNGHKLVRVNDVRLVSLSRGAFVVVVDVGVEGLLRRIGILKPIKAVITLWGGKIPSKFILWDDVETIDFSNLNIKLSKTYSKLQTLHPSDLADIIEDLGRKESAEVFSTLDEERAADVLEELDPSTQVHILESLTIEKAADVLDKMPAHEVADILDALEDNKAEQLLKEMEKETSEDVRELLDYPDNTVGSIMSTDVVSFQENTTVEEVLNELRAKQPEQESLYNLFVTNTKNELLATFSLRDLIISSPSATLSQIMKPSPIHLQDYQEIDEIAENVSKYNILAIPVVDTNNELLGMVVIDDVVEDLTRKRRTNK